MYEPMPTWTLLEAAREAADLIEQQFRAAYPMHKRKEVKRLLLEHRVLAPLRAAIEKAEREA